MLEFTDIVKNFPGVRALDGIAVRTVHALMGESGTGKPTLLKILSVVYRPDGGEIRLTG